MTEGFIETVYVEQESLRQRFNAFDYYGAMLRRELAAIVRREGPAGDISGQPPGTRTQTVWYMQGQIRVAVVHQYLLPDGSIGGSGRPDPKWLRDGNRILKLAPPGTAAEELEG